MSECNCCCDNSTPPWWVTMGFVPPTGNAGQRPPVTQQPSPPTGNAGQTQPVAQQPSPPSGQSIGSMIGSVASGPHSRSTGDGFGGPFSDLVSGTTGSTATNLVTGVLNPLGSLLHLL
jgi:hypothetical protein